MRQVILAIIFLCLLLPTVSFAGGKSGPEWEFTNLEIMDSSDENYVTSNSISKARKELVRAILKKCPQCESEDFYNRAGTPATRIHFPNLNGFYLDINTDPGTVEVQADPLSLHDWKAIAPKIQSLLFDTAAEIGIKADDELSAAHIHFSLLDNFGYDVLHFANFVTDFMNHEELSSGILEFDHSNAPPLSAAGQIEAYRRLWNDFNPREWTIEEYAKQVLKRAHNVTAEADWGPPVKYHDICLTRVADKRILYENKSVEIRSLRAQRNMEDYLLIVELFEKRIEYLKQFKTPIKFEPTPAARMTKADKIERFRKYVTEAGLEWSRYEKLIPQWDWNNEETEKEEEHIEAPRSESARLGRDLREMVHEWYHNDIDSETADHLVLKFMETSAQQSDAELHHLLYHRVRMDYLSPLQKQTVEKIMDTFAVRQPVRFKNVILRILNEGNQDYGLQYWERLIGHADHDSRYIDVMVEISHEPSLSGLRSRAIRSAYDRYRPHPSHILLAAAGTREGRRAYALEKIKNWENQRDENSFLLERIISKLTRSPYPDVRQAAAAAASSRSCLRDLGRI